MSEKAWFQECPYAAVPKSAGHAMPLSYDLCK